MSEQKTMQPSVSMAAGMDPKFFKSEAVDNSKFDDKDKSQFDADGKTK